MQTIFSTLFYTLNKFSETDPENGLLRMYPLYMEITLLIIGLLRLRKIKVPTSEKQSLN